MGCSAMSCAEETRITGFLGGIARVHRVSPELRRLVVRVVGVRLTASQSVVACVVTPVCRVRAALFRISFVRNVTEAIIVTIGGGF